MESHPVPQHISSYEFHLVGDMTLKQFIQVAAGSLIGLFIYSTPLPGFIKWPLILIFFLFGAALAFLPIEERSLDKWIVVFFKAIYSPTQYGWKPGSAREKLFQEESQIQASQKNLGVIAPKGAEVLEEYLKSIPTTSNPSHQSLERGEATFLENLAKLFSFQQPKTQTPAQESVKTVLPVGTALTQTAKPTIASPEEIPARPPTTVPQTAPVQIPKQEKSAFDQQITNHKSQITIPPQKVGPVFTAQKQTAAQKAQFSSQATPPIPPTTPNIVVGQVLDPEGKIIESVILEIRDDLGRPVRAVKSNKVGHFAIATPLYDGPYQITTEKGGFEFDPVSFEAKGEIIPPILIKATKTVPYEEPEIDRATQYFD